MSSSKKSINNNSHQQKKRKQRKHKSFARDRRGKKIEKGAIIGYRISFKVRNIDEEKEEIEMEWLHKPNLNYPDVFKKIPFHECKNSSTSYDYEC